MGPLRCGCPVPALRHPYDERLVRQIRPHHPNFMTCIDTSLHAQIPSDTYIPVADSSRNVRYDILVYVLYLLICKLTGLFGLPAVQAATS